jgi:hypothetical protein
MNHRAGEIGRYGFKGTGERSATMVCQNPYPCDFDRGIIEAMAKRFRTLQSVVKVVHDDRQACRKRAGESCTYHVAW